MRPPPPNPEAAPLQEVFLNSMFIFLRLGKPPPSCSFFPKAKSGEGRRPLSGERGPSPSKPPPPTPKTFVCGPQPDTPCRNGPPPPPKRNQPYSLMMPMQEWAALFRASRRRGCVADASVRRVMRKGTHRHSRWFFMYTLRLCYQQRPNRCIADLASAFLLLAARKRAVRVGKAKLRTQFILHYGKKSWLYHKTVTVFSLEVPKE